MNGCHCTGISAKKSLNARPIPPSRTSNGNTIQWLNADENTCKHKNSKSQIQQCMLPKTNLILPGISLYILNEDSNSN